MCCHSPSLEERSLLKLFPLSRGYIDVSFNFFLYSEEDREAAVILRFLYLISAFVENVKAKKPPLAVTTQAVQWIFKHVLRALEFICHLSFLCCRDIKKFKDAKKQFEKVSEEKENALVKNAQVQRNKQHEVEEATNILTATRKCFRHIALDYVLQVSAAIVLSFQTWHFWPKCIL